MPPRALPGRRTTRICLKSRRVHDEEAKFCPKRGKTLGKLVYLKPICIIRKI